MTTRPGDSAGARAVAVARPADLAGAHPGRHRVLELLWAALQGMWASPDADTRCAHARRFAQCARDPAQQLGADAIATPDGLHLWTGGTHAAVNARERTAVLVLFGRTRRMDGGQLTWHDEHHVLFLDCPANVGADDGVRTWEVLASCPPPGRCTAEALAAVARSTSYGATVSWPSPPSPARSRPGTPDMAAPVLAAPDRVNSPRVTALELLGVVARAADPAAWAERWRGWALGRGVVVQLPGAPPGSPAGSPASMSAGPFPEVTRVAYDPASRTATVTLADGSDGRFAVLESRGDLVRWAVRAVAAPGEGEGTRAWVRCLADLVRRVNPDARLEAS